ncbi:sugar ABC transporter ATP-binding protein [Ureibacillus chungkukjangi]|uniref:Monosaccharide ABC transporter ATP-binding protein (CUT2 family) n=1 Tax=Ureibacillus chungkukjangi TaxID=1202712 RepID=A0A318TP04_9BACL|nr:sugar ABC transporter ATP-binding protein [Ureibacillus chungkukjangi]PYF05627.1 monosaccharide ABC transporter ATP-binding protein (CUT2 family) [Ureibacillus chungkukjangi]
MSYVLEMKEITKSFPGVKALQNVNFSVLPGEIHCLIGANGAGKSTLMKILSGVYEMDEGSILLYGKEVKITSPADSKENGIATIYQELSLVEELSLAENIYLGNYLNPKGGFIKWNELNNQAKDLFSLLGLSLSPNLLVKEVSMGLKQMTEIAKALSTNCKIIVMDEPSTALSGEEINKLFDVIRLLKKQGYTIIYISHKLDELYTIGDRVTVLRNGKWVVTEELKNVSQSELIEHIIGRKIEKQTKQYNLEQKEEFLKVSNLTNKNIKNVSFTVGKGETIGLYGLVGSGRTELLRAIYGADKLIDGEIFINGIKKKITSPKNAVNEGMGLVPENRKTEGIIANLSIEANAFLPSLNKYSKSRFLQQTKIGEMMKQSIEKLKIKAPDPKTEIRNLSGGNQQKVIISKWLIHQSKLLLFDEPTQGIDVGSKDEIYKIMRDLASQGTSIVVASSEIDELLAICDRVLVMFEGRVVKEFLSPVSQKSEILNSAVSGS